MILKKIKEGGFTLVELLIVIALIAILSVAVLATINPIEQSNKARDAAMKNDAAEVLGAIERYYASQNVYPWNIVGTTIPTDESALLLGNDPRFGLVGGTSGTPDFDTVGELVNTSELKSSFSSKKPFLETVLPEDVLYVYHNATSNSNYVCYFPKATANRSAAKASDLKCVDAANGTIIDQSTGTGACAVLGSGEAWSYAPSATVANVACVPEGSIQ